MENQWEHQHSQLKRNTVTVPLPSAVEDWEDDVQTWPKITPSSILSYFLNAHDGEAMNNLKSAEAYVYQHSNKVGRVLLKEVDHNLMYLKADVEPIQSLSVPHHQAWVLVSASGEIQTAGCCCVAGQGRSCSHVAAILWKVENAVREGKTRSSCTEVQRKRNKATRKNTQLKKSKRQQFKRRKAEHLHEGSTASTSHPKSVSSSNGVPKLFRDHKDFKNYIDSSVMAPLYQLQTNGPLQQCYRLVFDSDSS